MSNQDERDARLATQAERLRGYRQELEDTLYLLKERTAENDRLTTALAAAEEARDRFRGIIALRDEEITELQAKIASRDAAIEGLRARPMQFFHDAWGLAKETAEITPGTAYDKKAFMHVHTWLAALSQASGSGEAIANAHRREGAEAAAKVVADHKQKQRATRIPHSASAYDTWLDHTCGQLEAAIRALYPAEGGPSHKWKRAKR